MAISVFDMFSIGIGPSSSHTVGPMRAAYQFAQRIKAENMLDITRSIIVELYGSLGLTGKGHGADLAIILGLEGWLPETVDIPAAKKRFLEIEETSTLKVLGEKEITFVERRDIKYHNRRSLPRHPNGMQFCALDEREEFLIGRTYYSVGGGFVIGEDPNQEQQVFTDETSIKFPFETCEELLNHCHTEGCSVSAIMMANERSWRSDEEINNQLLNIWRVMQECIDKGCDTEGILPGSLKVRRRAPQLHRRLKMSKDIQNDPFNVLDLINCYALAVSEENAAGGKVVTAPTNGAAGIIPAVLKYYQLTSDHMDEDDVIRFLLTAGAIGVLYKENASISGAEVGCQGEVGVACSMAAAGLAEVMGGTPEQVENAAEIAIEHNLGLTCDPVGGLVQVPCIERNAMGAVKAINAARLALQGDGSHKVSLDRAIATMQQTGADMMKKYKETSRGGLAVNVVEC